MINKPAEKKLPVSVQKYLKKYGYEKWAVESEADKTFNNVIVIPAIQEFENIKCLTSSLSQNQRECLRESLILFVVNNLSNSTKEVKNDNRITIEWLRKIISEKDSIELNIGLVDASSKGLELPEKDGGVGFARKIGMDLALTQFDYSNSKKKILICLDADCTVENNYLSSIIETYNQKKFNAAYVEYEHMLRGNQREKLAIICYEIFLRYYVLGLKYAGSPYSFPTIGSTMICDYESYINIGGMNKKKAAEDFYFMEKLAKISGIEKIDTTKVYPSSRASWRVPFGTGQRVGRFIKEIQNEYVLYDPQSFVILKEWLGHFNSKEIHNAEKYLSIAKSINIFLFEFLKKNSFKDAWNKIVDNSKTEEQIQKQKKIWFDGFRTLKLIHYLRDNGFPQLNMFTALDRYFGLINYNFQFTREQPVPELEIQFEYLKTLRILS